jgi:hypothetical protein
MEEQLGLVAVDMHGFTYIGKARRESCDPVVSLTDYAVVETEKIIHWKGIIYGFSLNARSFYESVLEQNALTQSEVQLIGRGMAVHKFTLENEVENQNEKE